MAVQCNWDFSSKVYSIKQVYNHNIFFSEAEKDKMNYNRNNWAYFPH